MKCKNCGKEIEKGALFCGGCSAPVKEKNHAPLYIAIAVLIFLIVAVIAVIAVITQGDGKDVETGKKSDTVAVDKEKTTEEDTPENKEKTTEENKSPRKEKEVSEKQTYDDGFYKKGEGFVLHNGKIIGAGKDGFSVIDAEKFESEVSFEGGFDRDFVTNGEKIYVTKDKNTLYEADLKKEEARSLYKVQFESEYSGLRVIGKGGEYVYLEEETEGGEYKIMYYNLKTGEYNSFKSKILPKDIYYFNEKVYYAPTDNAVVLSAIYEASPDGSNEIKVMEDIAAGTAFFRDGKFYCVKVADKEAYGNMPQYSAQIISYDVKTKDIKIIESTEISTDAGTIASTDFAYAYGFYNDAAGETECCVMYNDGRMESYFGHIVFADDDCIVVETDMNANEDVAVEYYIYTKDGAATPVKAAIYKDVVGYSNGRLYCKEYISDEDIYKLELMNVEF